jgi:two-component system sensor histidine kinase GlrK
MRVATKLASGYGLLILLLAGLVVYHLTAVRAMVVTNETLASLVLRLSRNATSQLARLDELAENGSKYEVTRDSGYVARFEAARSAFGSDLDELAGFELSAEERARLDDLSALWPRLFPDTTGLDELIAAHSGPRGDAANFDVWLDDAVRQLRERTRGIYLASERAMEAEMTASIAAAQRVQTLSLVSLVTALAVSLIVFGLVFRSITRPLAELREGTTAVAGGDFEYRLERTRADEFSELADDFNVMTQRLRELDHAKRDFLSQLSHDLKTPLAAIQDSSLLLLDEIPGALNERQRLLLEHNVTGGRRLASMLGKLLDVSRLEAGAFEYRFERCDVNDVVRQAVAEFQYAAERRGIALETDLHGLSLTVQCDGERILQVVENLLENALRFSPEDGVVRVEAREFSHAEPGVDLTRSGFALVTVADAGPGVPDDEKSRIFERFHQSSNGRSRPGGGVGLGLAICKEIVRAHDGRIWVSDVPTGGSLFSFLLPLTSARQPLAAGASGAA